MTQFQMHRSDNAAEFMVYYTFTCCSGNWYEGATSQRLQIKGDWFKASDNKGTAYYILDRGEIACPLEYPALIQWNMGRSGENMRFEYTCAQATISAGVYKTTTNFDKVGDNIVYLDRHNVACIPGYFLTYARIENEGTQSRRYKLTCIGADRKLPATLWVNKFVQIKTGTSGQCLEMGVQTTTPGTYHVVQKACNSTFSWFLEEANYPCYDDQVLGCPGTGFFFLSS